MARALFRLSPDPAREVPLGVFRLLADQHGYTFTTIATPAPENIDPEFLALQTFHRRIVDAPTVGNAVKQMDPIVPGDGKADGLDFNKRLAAVMNYPRLLRPLGLAIDCLIDAASVPSRGRVRVVPTLPSGAPHCTPWTTFGPATAEPFRPADDDESCRGLLKISDIAKFHLESLDVDGAALKLAAYAHTPQAAAAGRDDCADDVPPALRSAGISLIADGRAVRLQDAIDASAVFESKCATNDIVLTAKDVTSGYYVDVFARPGSAGSWIPLCRRNETYTILNYPNTLAFNDTEGMVRPAATRANDKPESEKAPPNDIFVHESLLRWSGWNLAAPLPVPADKTIGELRSTPKPKDWITAKMTALPSARLRFGWEYRMRVRLADLAGNALTFAKGGDDCVSAPLTYRRFEPVPPPPILRTALVTKREPGDQLNRVVVRDGGGTATRCFAPPRAAFFLAEHHGMFDSVGAPARGSFRAVGLDADGGFLQDPVTKDPLVTPPGAPPSNQPYYPDPLARRARIIVQP
ncbi:MAG TPA: hypothetical protein VG323_00580, partial [Thermoanaerobaculia bacterium]|nr:hypothetical protein [Thermoanaerobaculia bacterium]